LDGTDEKAISAFEGDPDYPVNKGMPLFQRGKNLNYVAQDTSDRILLPGNEDGVGTTLTKSFHGIRPLTGLCCFQEHN